MGTKEFIELTVSGIIVAISFGIYFAGGYEALF